MTEENYGFCPSCGAKVADDAVFCPECGMPLTSEAKEAAANGYANAPGSQYAAAGTPGQYQPMRGVFLFSVILIWVYAVSNIISGLSLAIGADALVETMETTLIEGKTMIEFFADMGLDMTAAEWTEYYRVFGIISGLSGLAAGAGGLLCSLHTKRVIAVACLVVASIIPFFGLIVGASPGLFGVLIGVIISILVYKSPQYFKD